VPGEGVRQGCSAAALWGLVAVVFGALLAAGGGIASASAGRASTPAGTSSNVAAPANIHAGVKLSAGGNISSPGAGAAGGGTNIGPAQINALGRPDLCWQANGNGGPVTLEGCDAAIQAQQWSLTTNGVLMNGIGYCLEARTGAARGAPLYIDFAGQCGGGPGQVWQFSAVTGQFSSGGTGVCAVAGGPITPGTEIVRHACPSTAAGKLAASRKWSLGYSAVSVQAGRGSGAAGGPFTAFVTVANAASAQTAYGMAVTFGLPRGLAASGLHVTGGAAGWTCHTRTLTCSGSLLAGTSGRVELAGRLPAGARRGASYAVSARASVAGTSPGPGTTRTTAAVTVAVGAAVAGAGTAAVPGAPAAGASGLGTVPLAAVIAVVLLVGGGLLIAMTRRPRGQARRAPGRETPGRETPGRPARGHRGQRRRPAGHRAQTRRADGHRPKVPVPPDGRSLPGVRPGLAAG
jgi:hypothetical protein